MTTDAAVVPDATPSRRPRNVATALLAMFALLLPLISGCASVPPPGETGVPAAPAGADRPAPAPVPAGAPATPAAAATNVEVSPLSEPFDWSDAVLYFAIVDRFADGDAANNAKVDRAAKGAFHGGDLAGLTRNIDEIAELGVNTLWITPVVKNIDGFVTGAGFPDWGYHGYWADDFQRLDPRFGSEADLKRLVAAAHQRKIRVLLDVVHNHAGYDSRYTKDPQTRDWLRVESRGACGSDDVTSCVSGLPDFRTERPDVADFLIQAHIGWARRTGIDGFRLDTVKHIAHEFWQEHRRRVDEQLGNQFFLLGEVWGGDAQVLDPYFAGDELDAGFDFGFQGSALSFVRGRGRAVAFDRYLASREKVRAGYYLSHFLSSHDVPGALFQLEGNKELFRLAAVLQFTARGIPLIYYGEEVGRAGGDWPDNRSDMPWGARDVLPGKGVPRDEDLRSFYKTLIAARHAHPALRRGSHSGLATEGDLYVFARRDEASGDAVVVAVNRGAAAASATIAPPAEWAGAVPTDLLGTAASVEAEGNQLRISVPARSARIFAIPR